MHLAFNRLIFLTYQPSDFNNWEKWEILCFHHTQWEVFFQIKFHPQMKFYSFHPGMKLTCKQNFFHPRTSFILGWDFISVTCKRTLSVYWNRNLSAFILAFSSSSWYKSTWLSFCVPKGSLFFFWERLLFRNKNSEV